MQAGRSPRAMRSRQRSHLYMTPFPASEGSRSRYSPTPVCRWGMSQGQTFLHLDPPRQMSASIHDIPFSNCLAEPQGQSLTQGGFTQCMQRRGMVNSVSSPLSFTAACWMNSQL